MSYNGYKNRETWNVCLWISNDLFLHSLANRCGSYDQFKYMLREMFEHHDMRYETPDGVAWSDSGIDLDKMQEFWAENFSKVNA